MWLWPWEEGLTEAISTYRVAADFCDQYPDFVFNHNESLLYEWVERNDEPLFRRIQALVKAGRWHIAGGSFIQPDLVGPSGESVIRQFLVGKTYFADKFGKEPTTAYNFDTFGHSQGLIQILQGCGFDSYIFCRPNAAALTLPKGSFRWVHRSGAEVVARRSDDHYITQGDILRQMVDGKWDEHYREEGDFLFLWGLGNHGGGPSHAEYADLQKLSEVLPQIEFIESTPEAFFKHSLALRGRENLPTVHGDFKPCMEGCYTSMLSVKLRHRRSENLMYAVEKYAALAWWHKQRAYPTADLTTAWKDILFAEFHDILPGSGIPKVEEDSINLLGHADEILRRKRAESLISLLSDEPLAERNETPIFVFNPHAWEVTQEVEIDYGIDRQFSPDQVRRRILRNGREIEAQFEKPAENLGDPNWSEWRTKAIFLATIPPLSYQRFETEYDVLAKEDIVRWKTPALPSGKKAKIVAGDVSLSLNRETGFIDEVLVKGQKVLGAGSFAPMVFEDTSHSWCTETEWKEPVSGFRLASIEEATRVVGSDYTHRVERSGVQPIRLIEDGPIRSVIEVIFVHGHSYIVQQYIVNKKRPMLHVEQTIFWAEHDKMLRLEVTHSRKVSKVDAEKCYSIDEETGFEEGKEKDYQHFLRFSGEDAASDFTVVSHGTHSYRQATKQRLYLGVLRSPSYAMHAFEVPGWERYYNRYMPRQEQGIRKVRFTFAFGELTHTTAESTRVAWEENVPLDPFIYFPTRAGKKSKPSGFISTGKTNVLPMVVKKAEAGDGLVIRIWETGGSSTRFSLSVAGKKFPLEIGAWQIKTFLLNRKQELIETDMIERPLPKSKSTAKKRA